MAEHEWWTAPTEGDKGGDVMVTGREDVSQFRSNPRFKYRVEVSWPYQGNASGMPNLDDSLLMEQVTDLLNNAFDRDPVAVMTGIYTGDGERTWVFYTLSINIFGRKLNEALAELPLLPLSIYCEDDPDWNEYGEMSLCKV